MIEHGYHAYLISIELPPLCHIPKPLTWLLRMANVWMQTEGESSYLGIWW